jgi:hypothetical protein
MDFVEFPIEFYSVVPNVSAELRAEAENRLLDLASGHTDMVGAAIAIESPAENPTMENEPIVYRARIVVYSRPRYISAEKQHDTVEGALKGALDAVGRQVREKRKKLGEAWKRADLPGAPGSNTPVDEDIHQESE